MGGCLCCQAFFTASVARAQALSQIKLLVSYVRLSSSILSLEHLPQRVTGGSKGCAGLAGRRKSGASERIYVDGRKIGANLKDAHRGVRPAGATRPVHVSVAPRVGWLGGRGQETGRSPPENSCTYTKGQVLKMAREQFGNEQEPLCVPGPGQGATVRLQPVAKLK